MACLSHPSVGGLPCCRGKAVRLHVLLQATGGRFGTSITTAKLGLWPLQAQETHAQIRGWLADKVSPEVAQATRIIYGGSVSPSNSDTLAQERDIDGFLVGGASLKPDFIKVIKSADRQREPGVGAWGSVV